MALPDQPYIPLYVQDIMTCEKLNECSAAAHGIFIKGLMCLMHKSETYGRILLKQKYKQNESKCLGFALQLVKHLPYTKDELFGAITELVDEKVCYFDGDYLCNGRMIKDYELSVKRSKAGKKGGQKTQLIKPNFAKANAKAKSEANPEYEYENDNENINDNVNEIQKPEIEFETFWNAYDKKVGDKDRIEKKWNSLDAKTHKLIMAHIAGYVRATPDKTYRKNPETYLNQKGWTHEIIVSTKKLTQRQKEPDFNAPGRFDKTKQMLGK